MYRLVLIYRFAVLWGCLFLSLNSLGQLITIQDTAFAKKMCIECPIVLRNDCKQMDTSAASAISYRLNFSQSAIHNMAEVVYFKDVYEINASRNQLSVFPDVKPETKWGYLDLSYNKLTQVPDLDPLKNNLHTLILSNNNLVSLDGIQQLAKLKTLDASNNALTHLPTLDLLVNIETMDLSENFLSFHDLNSFVNSPAYHPNYYQNYKLGPQKSLTPDTTMWFYQSTNMILRVPIDEGVAGLTYTWFKNGVYYKTTSTNVLTVNNIQKSDTGYYCVNITSNNPKLKDVVLKSGETKVIVLDCPKVTKVLFNTHATCESVSSTLTQLSLSTPSTSYYLYLENAYSGDTMRVKKEESFKVPEGTYDLIIFDKGCSSKKREVLKVVRPQNCPSVFTPNGDGYLDELFVEGMGEAEIVNKAGRIVKKIKLPGYWDGTDHAGMEVPLGSYAIIRQDGTTEKVTLLR